MYFCSLFLTCPWFSSVLSLIDTVGFGDVANDVVSLLFVLFCIVALVRFYIDVILE